MGIFDKLFGSNKQSKLDVSARFRLERQSTAGTMSTFRAANEVGSSKVFGIKFLDDEKTTYFKNRFKGLNKPSEGEIALQIKHERIVETFEYGETTTGQEYILMEYIDGPGLDSLLRKGDVRVFKGNRLNLIRQMAQAIQAVHEAGFIHRDVCPRNFICNKEVTWLKLIDFGLTVPDQPEFRTPGNRTGTPQYMAPEIVRRRATDQRVDIFAFGVTIYRFLTFEHPWGSTDTTGKTALAHDTVAVTDIMKHRPDLNPKLAKAVHRCLEVSPDKRPSTMKKFLGLIRDVKQEMA
ncbi:MAG: serine/threonine-protein kinase [Planctomycetota bacterium]